MPMSRMSHSAQIVIFRPARHRPARRAGNVTRPDFEAQGHAALRLWWLRLRWRGRLRAELGREPAEVLADFGTTAAALRSYLARPFWRA